MPAAAPCSRPSRRRPVVPTAALAALTAVTIAVGAAGFGAAAPAAAAPGDSLLDDSAIAPPTAAYGRFIDTYTANTSSNTSPTTNPGIGVLSGMLDLWQPGATWDSGQATAEGAAVLDANIAHNVRVAEARTAADETAAWVFDRRHQSYSAIDGLGAAAPAFRDAMNAGTTIPDVVPADATTVKYDDGGNAAGRWADAGSALGAVVGLVDAVRGPAASSNPSKNFYAYKRPFRWVDDAIIVPSLLPVRKPDAEAASDGGFPSGHTNAAFLASFALADAAPQYQAQLIANAAEIGDSRIVAGMHSPLDVIGGRVLATALAAAALNDPANAGLRDSAFSQAQGLLATLPAPSEQDYDALAAAYRERMTYGLPATGDTTLPARVPAGAEVLLEHRLPYLDAQQRRWVLHSTAIASGHAVLDDAEGWGRLNLFEASNGYGAFDTDVTVTMDAAAGGASAADTWRNDIDGAGSLTKAGSGALTLAGDNAYAGGTVVDGGALVAATPAALGTGDVTLAAGALAETTEGLLVGGDFAQTAGATLELSVEGDAPALTVAGSATFGGTLRVDLGGAAPDAPQRLIAVGASEAGSTFSSVEIVDAAAGFAGALDYRADGVYLVPAAAPVEPPVGAEPPVVPAEPGTAPGTLPGAVPAAPTGSPAGAASAPSATAQRLARTGGEESPTGLLIGGFLLAAGGSVVLLSRRPARR
ncbi:phosphatase PAP2 family protein [Microbacterium thalli]|uniref:Phosphatase PAP2 family protein n=1 Tax=Microbacterium thalli TaxID=3027921 RepID=A0ABT5SGS0_9MICO|nr:phosphatase PAP2 family protein [Microbacterium thalli]MDD7962021.1 phosphatase PAP2 family protein [Microbacterium thalli]